MIAESLDRGPTIDGQNPWPGLCAFDEHSEQFFAGRDAERSELWRLVSQAPLTVLFGKSGLGKTSLILAGLFPRLRQQNVLPVYVRLDVRDRSAPLIRQAALALHAEITKHRIDGTTPLAGESLWQHLHRQDAQWWSSKNQPLTPLFVFDQLEEAFTLGATNSEGIERLRLDLADVIENRIPLELARRVETGDVVEGLDLRGQRYKVLLSLREDYLPDLEEWKIELPSVMRNRLRLLPLGADAALRVVSGTTSRGKVHGLVSDEAAREIVRFVAAAQSARGRRPGRNSPPDASGALPEKLEIEPALLSMVCEGLNERRKALMHPTIDAKLLKQTGASIIGDFYRRCVSDVPQNTQRFIEDILITESGYRNSYPVQDAIDQSWLTEELLHRLIDQRLLRVSHQLGADRVELIHDLLTEVVRQERDRQRERIRQRRQAQRRWLEGGLALSLIAICAVFFGLWRSAQEAETKTRAALREAVSGKVTMESRAILEGGKVASGDVALLLAAAGYRLRPDADTLGGLQFALNSAPRLVKVIGFRYPVIAVSPDGHGAVTVDGNVLHLVNATTGRALAPPHESHGGRVASVAYSADGKILVSGSSDATLRAWDASTGKARGKALAGHTAVVASVAVSNDGKLLVSGSADGTVRLWIASTGEPHGDPLRGHNGAVTRVAFSPDGRILASGGVDKTVRLWEVSTGKPVAAPLRGHNELISALAFSPDGKTLASGGGDRMVRLWDAASGLPRGPPLQGHTELVSKLAFSPDGGVLASASADKTIRLWDVHTGQLVGEPLRGHSGAVTSIVYDGRMLVSGGLDGSLRIWDTLATVATPGLPVSGGGWIRCVAISPDGNTVASGNVDNQVRLWDVKTQRPRGAALEGHTAGILSVAFSHDGRMLASGSQDGTARLWDLDSSTPRSRILTGPSGAVSTVAFSPDGRLLASGGQDKTVRLWVVATGEPFGGPLVGHAGHVMSVAFSPDGKTLASAGEDSTIRMWDVETGRLRSTLEGHGGAVSSVAFSRDGSLIVSGSHDGSLRLWDVHTGQARGAPLQGHAQIVLTVALSADGKTIASGGGDKTLRFWDAVSGQPLGSPLMGHAAPVYSVAFSPDGKTVVSASLDKSPRFSDAPSAWAERVCARLMRNLSHAEWAQYVGDVDYVIQCPGLPVPSD